MKIVRLKRGYTIRLSDSEWDMLCALVDEGEGGICTDGTLAQQGIPPATAAAYTRRINRANQFLNIDEDRRGP